MSRPSLLKQIDTPARTLLGTASFPYVARADDTMSSLAERFLGNPMLFYALARYNGIDAPRHARGRPRAAHPRPREARAGARRKGAASPARRDAQRRSRPSRRAAAPPPPVARANPAQAAGLRAAGLEQMNRGAIDRAVALLTSASQLDPANAADPPRSRSRGPHPAHGARQVLSCQSESQRNRRLTSCCYGRPVRI